MPPHPTPSTAAAQHLGRLQHLHKAGVSIWLDTRSRDLLATGEFDQLIAGSAVTGATSNPTIFAAAITGSELYDEQLHAAVARGIEDPRELFFELALDDVGEAADRLRGVYDASAGGTGSSPSNAPPSSPTTPKPPSSRQPACGSASRDPT